MNYRLLIGETEYTPEVSVPNEKGERDVRTGETNLIFECQAITPDKIRIRSGGKWVTAYVAATSDGVWVSVAGRTRFVQEADKAVRRRSSGGGQTAREITPPMPAQVDSILVQVGDMVEEQQPVIVVSAMKTKMKLGAPYSGTVTAVNTEIGAQVMPGDILVEIKPESEGDQNE